LDRRWGGIWLAREKCTSTNNRCWLLVAACCLLHQHRHRHRQPVLQNLLKIFLLHGFCNKLVIYLSSSVSNNSIRGLDFLVAELLLLLFVCLFVLWVLQFVA
jgi:hypothetical protein